MSLYEKDFCAWSHEQSKLLLDRRWGEIDLENIAKEIEGLSVSFYMALESHMTNILMHMLMFRYQFDWHTKSWEYSVIEARFQVSKILRKNPSLKPSLKEIRDDAYFSARLRAASETRLDLEIFPKECLWTIEEILDTKQGEQK